MKLHKAEFQDEKCDERFRFVGGEHCLVPLLLKCFPIVKIRVYFRVFCFPVAIPAIFLLRSCLLCFSTLQFRRCPPVNGGR